MYEFMTPPQSKTVAFLDEIYAKYDRDNLPQVWDSRAKGKESNLVATKMAYLLFFFTRRPFNQL